MIRRTNSLHQDFKLATSTHPPLQSYRQPFSDPIQPVAMSTTGLYGPFRSYLVSHSGAAPQQMLMKAPPELAMHQASISQPMAHIQGSVAG